ncbi:hypothetical protein L21SP3_00467 [Sedimentisphaera cyanobacteriorum]|uniref:Cytidylate kinase n=1 Tax=Sedimentisphaera cyanobacteriorum TaxID=1940790 RepID=A0A1Q2HML5_9BACT|nr:cytidylate kinase-like family protein [Sedimentisphaera cyanobacteriorum]AQQ08678.1 hypothetical protein L21SP3_00467 [Sedimentisphaera cyanobacteriorum]
MRSGFKNYYTQQRSRNSNVKECPFLTISREYGCCGIELAEKVADLVEQRCSVKWEIYHKDLLQRLAKEAGVDFDTIEKQRLAKPGIINEFLSNLKQTNIPDGYEIRKRVAFMVRDIAGKGNAVIVGQGGAAATGDMAGGLHVRIEAPRHWRVLRVRNQEGLSDKDAEKRLEELEKSRIHLHRAYEAMCPRRPAFNLLFDNSKFTAEQISEQIFYAMKLCGMIKI